MTFVKQLRPNYGDGSDGVTTLSGTVAKQTYQLGDGSAISGLTLSSSYIPSIIRCKGRITVSGNVNGDGAGSLGGYGWNSNIGRNSGQSGRGPGGGMGGACAYAGSGDSLTCGGGAGHAANGSDGAVTSGQGGFGGQAYQGLGSIITNIFGIWNAGSGGGGGGGRTTDTGGGPGGNGGGGLVIIAPEIVVNSVDISLDGANGANGSGTGASGGGGGGSGGFLVLVGNVITLPASGTVATALGGSGGASVGGTVSGSGGAGSVGRIYLVYISSISTDAASRCNPAATVLNWSVIPTTIG